MANISNKPFEDKLWRPYDEKHRLLWTQMPNGFLKNILLGEYKLVEIRVLLFIVRMSFGFKREETNYLSLEGFATETDIAKSHLSKTIKGLLKKEIILGGAVSGNGRKYAINLFPFGITMKDYVFGNKDGKIERKETKTGNQSNQFSNKANQSGNPKSNKNNLSLGKTMTSVDGQNAYKNTDTQLDRNSDTQSDNYEQVCELFIKKIKKDITFNNILDCMLQLDGIYPNGDRMIFVSMYEYEIVYIDGIENQKNSKLFKEANEKFLSLNKKSYYL
jgi:hypothetical protein